jgi:stearoyl-CoA desaturase (delta-9 desaturase)
VFGWPVFLGSLLAGLVGHHLPLGINVLCHLERFGYRNFNVKDDSRNIVWYALITGGEGWHNNHHAHPGSARFGLRWFELDSSWFTLKILKSLGLISRLHEARIEEKPLELDLQPERLQPERQPEAV